jgi:hypothetical protein
MSLPIGALKVMLQVRAAGAAAVHGGTVVRSATMVGTVGAVELDE